MTNTIFVPIDGSDKDARALAVGADLAELADASVIVARVRSPESDRARALFIEMPVLDNALSAVAGRFAPLLLGLKIGRPVFEGVSRMLKPGGRFVIAMMHPAFRGPKATYWGWDDKAKAQFRRVDRGRR